MNLVPLSKYWAFQLGGWGTFALVNTFFAYSFDKLNDAESVQIYFGRLGIFVVLGLLVTHAMRFVIIKLNTLQKAFDKQIIQFLFITFCFSMIVSFFNVKLMAFYGWLSSSEMEV